MLQFNGYLFSFVYPQKNEQDLELVKLAFVWRQGSKLAKISFFLLYQNISHCLNMLFAIIWRMFSLVST